MNESESNKRKTPLKIDDMQKRFSSIGFENLTEIQRKAIPLILDKKNSLLIAPTGSGKTESAVIPIFSQLKFSKKSGMIKALYITPLRALNRDVFRRITKYAHDENLEIEIRHGDTSQKIRKKISENPPDVLITTPETLVILLTQKKYLDALSELEWVVIDEVHELLPNERGTQLSLSLERLAENSKMPFTRIGLSATVGNPEDAAKFVSGSDRDYVIGKDTSIRQYDVAVEYVDGTVTDVANFIIEHVTKIKLDSPVLLFTNTRGRGRISCLNFKRKVYVKYRTTSWLSFKRGTRRNRRISSARHIRYRCMHFFFRTWSGYWFCRISNSLWFSKTGFKINSKNWPQ